MHIEERLGEKSPFYEELLLSKCGQNLTAEEHDIYYNREKKYSKRLVDTVRKQSADYSTCEMNVSAKERGKFMNKHGLKAQNSHDTKRWVGLVVRESGGKYVVTEYSVDN